MEFPDQLDREALAFMAEHDGQVPGEVAHASADVPDGRRSPRQSRPCALAEAGPPALLAQARYVALGYDRGDGFVSETDVRADVLPEERAALQAIRAGIEQWDKYQVVVRPGQAELLIAVRKGRLATRRRRHQRRGAVLGAWGRPRSGPGPWGASRSPRPTT